MNFAGSSGGGAAVDFLVVGSRSHAGEAVEPKICEWCGAGFWRPVPASAREGAKWCPSCVTKMQLVKEARSEAERKKPVRRSAA